MKKNSFEMQLIDLRFDLLNVKIKIHWEGLQESGTPNQRFASERSM